MYLDLTGNMVFSRKLRKYTRFSPLYYRVPTLPGIPGKVREFGNEVKKSGNL